MEERYNVQSNQTNGLVLRCGIEVLVEAVVVHLPEQTGDGVDLVIVKLVVRSTDDVQLDGLKWQQFQLYFLLQVGQRLDDIDDEGFLGGEGSGRCEMLLEVLERKRSDLLREYQHEVSRLCVVVQFGQPAMRAIQQPS